MPETVPLNAPPDWRGRFPFRVGAPSWVLPLEHDNLVGNVRYLSQSVDRVQLLFFESQYIDEMLVPDDLRRLADIRAETGLAYSVHLPSDFKLLAHDIDSTGGKDSLLAAFDLIARLRDETAFLQPETYIMHLDGIPGADSGAPRPASAHRMHAVERVLDAILLRFPDAPSWLLLENTDWDFGESAALFAERGIGICADFGHLYHSGYSLTAFLESCGPLIRELHLHGFNASGDHLPLSEIDPKWLEPLQSFVAAFRGTVTMELFHAERLWASLHTLKNLLVEYL